MMKIPNSLPRVSKYNQPIEPAKFPTGIQCYNHYDTMTYHAIMPSILLICQMP